jgi:hypothetical protein
MAFTLPSFNLSVDIYTGPWLTKVLRVTSDANLAFGRRSQVQYPSLGDPGAAPASVYEILLLPAITDIRSYFLTGQTDVVEVPSGSGRWYGVEWVDDVGKGFDNEHRAAGLLQISHFLDPVKYAGLSWPVPMP